MACTRNVAKRKMMSLTSMPGRKRTVEEKEEMTVENKQKKVNNTSYEDVLENLAANPAEDLIEWLLNPMKPERFFEQYWEQKPFRVPLSNPKRYHGLYSLKEFERSVQKNSLNYNKEIDVETYVDGKHKTLEYDFKVLPSYLWAALKTGYSIRMPHSQVYSWTLRCMCSFLQEYFSNHVDANTYITHPNTQVFPPCCNDTDAFILQIEGKKGWKVDIPSASEKLSSVDWFESDIDNPYMEAELHPGDLLYIPSGCIYQAQKASGTLSLHIVVTVSQLNTWGNFLRHAFSSALDTACQKNEDFCKSIPRNYLDYMGGIYSDSDSKERQDFNRKAGSLIQETLEFISLDSAADAHGVSFIRGSMPPILTGLEKTCSVHFNGATFNNGDILVAKELSPETKIRFIRKRAFKLIVDSEGSYLCHSLSNKQKEEDLNMIAVDPENLAALTSLFKIENFIKIKDLPHGESEKLLEYLQLLYENGVLMTDDPLPFEE